MLPVRFYCSNCESIVNCSVLWVSSLMIRIHDIPYLSWIRYDFDIISTDCWYRKINIKFGISHFTSQKMHESSTLDFLTTNHSMRRTSFRNHFYKFMIYSCVWWENFEVLMGEYLCSVWIINYEIISLSNKKCTIPRMIFRYSRINFLVWETFLFLYSPFPSNLDDNSVPLRWRYIVGIAFWNRIKLSKIFCIALGFRSWALINCSSYIKLHEWPSDCMVTIDNGLWNIPRDWKQRGRFVLRLWIHNSQMVENALNFKLSWRPLAHKTDLKMIMD